MHIPPEICAELAIHMHGRPKTVEVSYPIADERALVAGWRRLARAAPLRVVVLEGPLPWGA